MARWTLPSSGTRRRLPNFAFPISKPIRRQVRQQEPGRLRAPQTGRGDQSQYVMERQGRDRSGRRQLQRRIHDLPDLGQ